MNQRIKYLQAQIQAEENRMSRCTHEWNEVFYNPETVKEGYGFKPVGRGSDMWHEYEGYHDVQKPRWTRICKKCGKEDHTDKQRPVVTHHVPDFK